MAMVSKMDVTCLEGETYSATTKGKKLFHSTAYKSDSSVEPSVIILVFVAVQLTNPTPAQSRRGTHWILNIHHPIRPQPGGNCQQEWRDEHAATSKQKQRERTTVKYLEQWPMAP